MPVYEEKLISPLAVRFTQDHIRTTFRDGRPVEPTVKEIKVGPGSGDYDVILRAPFPHIEIVRWSPKLADEQGDNEREIHWFSLDNRRLYCLQRAAADLLPKRAAAVVEILYADQGSVRRKYDSETEGVSVTVSPSTKCAPIFTWYWKDEVLPRFGATVAHCHRAYQGQQLLERDDARRSIDDLQDIERRADRGSGGGTRREREARATRKGDDTKGVDGPRPRRRVAAPQEEECSAVDGGGGDGEEEPNSGRETPSTMDDVTTLSDGEPASMDLSPQSRRRRRGRTDSDGGGRAGAARRTPLELLRSRLEGAAFLGRRGDTYELRFQGKDLWCCTRRDSSGAKKFTVTYDEQWNLLWWGTDKAYFSDVADFMSDDIQQVGWYAASDWNKVDARFAWKRAPLKPTKAEGGGAKTRGRAPARKEAGAQADSAPPPLVGQEALAARSGGAHRRGRHGARPAT